MNICTDVVQLPPSWGGEFCACTLPAVHVFDASADANGRDRRAHLCSCGTWWYDDQQVNEVSRLDAEGERAGHPAP